MTQQATPVRKRTPGKLATTTYANEIVDFVDKSRPVLRTGTDDETGFRLVQLVKVTAAAAGGGKYTGRIWNRPTAGMAASGNLLESEMGTDLGGDILIANAQEVGQSTHDLTAGTPKSKIFLGIYRGLATDGITPIFVINGDDWENCEEDAIESDQFGGF
jgi:hypothetical protein